MSVPIPVETFYTQKVLQSNEPDVWKAFREGDKHAYSYIFLNYKDVLYNYGLTLIPDEALVCDCIQELFLELWIKRQNLAQVNSIKYYLLVSFRRLLINKIDSSKKNAQLFKQAAAYSDDGYTESTENVLIYEQLQAQQQDKLSAMINHLPKRQQEALYLRYYEKLSYEEIMEVMSLSYKSVRNLVSLALQMLRKELSKQDFFYSLTFFAFSLC